MISFERGRTHTGPALFASNLHIGVRPRYATLVFGLLFLAACGGPDARNPRPATWAAPVASEELDNLFQVSDDLYRCEQPDEEGFAELEAMGVKSVLNLREHHTDDDEAEGAGLELHRLRWDTDDVTAKQVIEALTVLRDAPKPVVVHCWHGSDRTGTVCAAYRIVFEDWDVELAVDEMIYGGFGYHEMFDNLPKLLRSMDWDEVRRAMGSGSSGEGSR